MFDFYCFPGQCHFFLLRTTNCSHHICQLQQQLSAAARHPPNWWALSGFPVSNMEQGWSASVHRAVWGLGVPAAEPGGWNPETPDSESDRTGSWNPHRYHLLTTTWLTSNSAKSTNVRDSEQNMQNPVPREEYDPVFTNWLSVWIGNRFSYVSLGKFLNFLVPQHCHLGSGNKDSYLILLSIIYTNHRVLC